MAESWTKLPASRKTLPRRGSGSALADAKSANGAPLPGSGSVTSISYVIGIDGKIHDFGILDRQGFSTLAEAQLQLWRQTSYEPAKCAGQPVPMQIITELSAAPQALIFTYLHDARQLGP